jgi:hypothetical protein
MLFRWKPVSFARIGLALSMGLGVLLLTPLISGNDGDERMKSYQVEFETDLPEVSAEEPFTLTLRILDSANSTPVMEFDEVHTKLLHLIVVSENLTEFLHLHPDYQEKGVFVLENMMLPKEANYILFADFTPAGENQQVARLEFSIANAQPNEAQLTISEHDVTASLLNFQLDLPDPLKTNEETAIRFQVMDAANGEPVNGLDEYLGAAGHLVIISESGEIYLHTHPAGHDMTGMQMEMNYGPEIEFMAEFPARGLYAMWLQVQYEGEVYTAPFVIDVTQDSEATHETHQH